MNPEWADALIPRRDLSLVPQGDIHGNSLESKITERHMLDALCERYSKTSQGGSIRYSFGEHVRSAAGFDAQRTADFMAMDLWPNFGKGLELHGFEVKVSRSDWLVELKNPWKSEAFRPYMNRWWLAASDPKIVKDDLPEGWGLMVMTARGLRVVVQAPANPDVQPMPKTMMASFTRAIQLTATRRALINGGQS